MYIHVTFTSSNESVENEDFPFSHLSHTHSFSLSSLPLPLPSVWNFVYEEAVDLCIVSFHK